MSMTARIVSAFLMMSTTMIPTQMTTAPTNHILNSKSNAKPSIVAKANPIDIKQEFGQVINVDSYLCFRTGPSVSTNVQGKFYEGMTFKILSKEGDWYKITHNNIDGYVYKDFVETYTDKMPHKQYQAPKGQPIAKLEISKVIHKAQPTIKRVVKSEHVSEHDEKDMHHYRKVRVQLTAYDNSEESSGQWGSQTAMGTRTRTGVIAAPKGIKLGTKVKIPSLSWYKSDEVFTVEDRGGAVVQKDNGDYVIDVWFPSGTDLNKFGRQYTYMYIMD